MQAYPLITKERIVGHCDVSPGRKIDPGQYFDWARYLQALQPCTRLVLNNKQTAKNGIDVAFVNRGWFVINLLINKDKFKNF